jgi:protein-disulfide isomerase
MAAARRGSKPPGVKAPRQKGSSSSSSRRSIAIALGVALVAAAALIVGALAFRKSDTPTPVGSPVVDIGGIPQSGRVLGDPNANVTLIEFADPQCPACRYYTLNIYPTLVDQYVRTGKVKTQYHGFPFIGPDSIKALRFLMAASFQNKLWQLMEALYRNQGAENSGWVTEALVRRVAGEIRGLDVDRLFTDSQSRGVSAMINSDLEQVQAKGLSQTPSFLIKVDGSAPYLLSTQLDTSSLRSALDDALAK